MRSAVVFLLILAWAQAKPRFRYYDGSRASAEDYRLPSFYVPTSYKIELNFTEDAFTASQGTFDGLATVKFQLLNQSDELKFHAHHSYITIHELSLNGLTLDPSDYTTNNVTDIVTVNFAAGGGLAPRRTHTLVVTYTAKIATDMSGVYKSSYVDDNNDTVYLVTTQFESVDARRAFPSFDEPYLKATFDFTIGHPQRYNVLFNTEADSWKVEGTNVTEHFKTTPKMSTYLVAFVLSDFTCDQGENIGTVKYQVCSRENLASSRKFAVDIGPKILQKLNDYTQFSYDTDMQKMDQVAIPDFSAGAMENWGLVTYRESALLYDENESSNKQYVATVIAHEFAHQWFGNLVTCKWWSETFLNEGFATYFEYFITHEVEELRQWQLDKQFVTDVVQYVMALDSLVTAPSLRSAAATPAEISAKFGTITYDKGGAIIRMVSHILGESSFQKGLQKYLNLYKNGYAEPDDLWNVLNDVDDANMPEGVTLSDVMANWVEKPGYPLLTVTLDGTALKLTQERFLLSDDDEDKETKWYVPITYTESTNTDAFNSTNPVTWLAPSDTEKVIQISNESVWVILNNQQTGYYRVNYDNALWDEIASALNGTDFGGIPDLNRAQIVDDAFTLARAGKLRYSKVFKVIEFLAKDVSYFPWIRAFNGFSFIDGKISQADLKRKHQEHILSLMRALYASVPISKTKDDQIYSLTQVAVGNWACALGEEECVGAAKSQFAKYKSDGAAKPDKNLRRIVYCHALRHSTDASDWDFLWNVYLESDLASEKSLILATLGCSGDVNKLKQFLTMSIADDSKIRSQDRYSVFSAVYGASDEGLQVALDFFIDNYKQISEKYKSMSALSSIVTGMASKFTTQAQIDKLKEFVKSTDDLPDDLLKSIDQAIETAETNLDWIKNYEDDLYEYYGAGSDTGGSETVTLSLVTALGAIIALLGFN